MNEWLLFSQGLLIKDMKSGYQLHNLLLGAYNVVLYPNSCIQLGISHCSHECHGVWLGWVRLNKWRFPYRLTTEETSSETDANFSIHEKQKLGVCELTFTWIFITRAKSKFGEGCIALCTNIPLKFWVNILWGKLVLDPLVSHHLMVSVIQQSCDEKVNF